MPRGPMASRPRVGVSACLLGDPVRYDGGHKRHALVSGWLRRWAEPVPVCPEVETGLGTPRPPMRLQRSGSGTRLVVPSTGADHTRLMERYAAIRLEELRRLGVSGYVLKGRSPSCGRSGVPVYVAGGGEVGVTSGLFAGALATALPDLPVVEEVDLEVPARRRAFRLQVGCRALWLELAAEGWSRATLGRFHRHCAPLLAARRPRVVRDLERLLADTEAPSHPERLARRYWAALADRLGHPCIRRSS